MSQDTEKQEAVTSAKPAPDSERRYKYIALSTSVIAIVVTLLLAIVLASGRSTPPPVDNNPEQTESERQKQNWKQQDLAQVLIDNEVIGGDEQPATDLDHAKFNRDIFDFDLFLDFDNDGQLELIAPVDSGGTGGILNIYVFDWQDGKPLYVQTISTYKADPELENGHLVITAPYYEGWEPNCCASRIYKDVYKYDEGKLALDTRELKSLIDPDGSGYISVPSDLATDNDYVNVCQRYVWYDVKQYGEASVIKSSTEEPLCPSIVGFGRLRFDYTDTDSIDHAEDASSPFTINANPKDEFNCALYNYFALRNITCFWTHEDSILGSVTLELRSAQQFTEAKQQLTTLLRSIKSY